MTIHFEHETKVPDFRRDQWGRPLIVPAAGGKAKPYTRASGAAKTIEDTYNLELWARRNEAYGMAYDASLVARVIAIGGNPGTWTQEEKKAVNLVCEDAQRIAQAHKAADIGTAVHALTERLDRGEEVVGGPYAADLEAYVKALTAAGLTTRPEWVECRMACDELEMAGTADRILTNGGQTHYIADVKTGPSVDYGGLGWAAQLAAYAHSDLYDVDTDRRIATPKLDTTTGIIIHLPAGQGRCTLYAIDLVSGYRAAQLANEIRAVRRASKRWIAPMAPTETAPTPDRRQQLRDRYGLLSEDERKAYGEIAPDPNDLDAIEAALNTVKVDAFNVRVEPPVPPAPKETPMKPVTLDDLDQGKPIEDGDLDPLRERTATLDRPAHSWLRSVITDAAAAGVAIAGPHTRTFDLLRGLVSLAANGSDDDGTVRELAATALGDDAPFFARSAGQAVGILDADAAQRFADLCLALGDDPSAVVTQLRPAPISPPPAA